MINTDDLISLSWEQKKTFRAAIGQGYFDDYERDTRAWKHSLVGSLLRLYPSRCATLNILKDILGHVPTWSDLDNDTLRDFVDAALETRTASSVRTMCAELKSVLNKNKRKFDADDYIEILSVKGEASQAVYLTHEEIQRIIDYTPVGRSEQLVRRNFIVECLTGARRCDAERLTINNCDIDTGTLSYVPKKTPGTIVTVPVDEKRGLRYFLADVYGHSCDRKTFNETLRHICMNCYIDTMTTLKRRGKEVTAPKYEFVSSHTGRRSFATNLYLAGVSIEDIAQLMGHGKNIETTKRYICAERQMSSNIMAYFQTPVEEVQEYEYQQ